jgi:hypothetical protein
MRNRYKNFGSWRSRFVTLLLFTASYGQAIAKDLFQATAVTTTSDQRFARAMGPPSMLPLVRAAIKAQGPFSPNSEIGLQN